MEKCIYVVEDNAQIREIIEFLLVEESYKVKAYPNVAAFWQEMHQHIPDLIVLDVMLPDGNGLDICAKLKQDVKTHDIPVMMMSANNYLRKAKANCPAEDFINKPFDINDFVNRVEHYIAH